MRPSRSVVLEVISVLCLVLAVWAMVERHSVVFVISVCVVFVITRWARVNPQRNGR